MFVLSGIAPFAETPHRAVSPPPPITWKHAMKQDTKRKENSKHRQRKRGTISEIGMETVNQSFSAHFR